MRPLAVISLVIAAIAALAFALYSLSGDDSGRGTSGPVTRGGGPVGPAAERSSAELEAADTFDATGSGAEGETGIRTVATAEDTDTRTSALDGGQVVFSNELTGIVRDLDGLALAGAKVTIERMPIAEQLVILQHLAGNAPTTKKSIDTTDEEGKFRIRQLEPATDYQISVLHDDFALTKVSHVEVGAEGTFRRDVTMETGYLLLGYVFDDGGQPVLGATLELLPSLVANLPPNAKQPETLDKLTTETDATGAYRIENVTMGTKMLHCRAKGYGSKSAQNVNFVGPKDKPVTKDFRLNPALSIAGQVVDPAYSGVEGATVEALFFGSGQASRGRTTTDASGGFEVTGLSEGSYMVVVYADGFKQHREPRVTAGTMGLTLELAEQGGVLGTVVDGQGIPVPNFSLSLRQVNANAGYYGRAIKNQSFQTEDGAFEIGGVEAGTYVVQASAKGFAPTYSDSIEVVQGIYTPDVVVEMSKGGTIAGRVVDRKTGQPVSGAKVTTFDNNHIDSPMIEMLGMFVPRTTTEKSTVTGKDGTFEIAMVTPEVYQLQIEHSSYTKEVIRDLRVDDGRPTEVPTVKLTAGAVLHGTVYGEDGKPLANASINVRPANPVDGLGRTYTATAGSDGRFTLRRIASGSYIVNATSGPAQTAQDPFVIIGQMRKSEAQITLSEGKEYTQDLYLGG